MKVDGFEIHLDEASGCYFAGQSIRGELTASLSVPVNLKEVSITLKGEARTNWINKISDNIYDTLEPYVNEKQRLVQEDDEPVSGVRRLKFEFRLSPNLPGSFEGEFGYVRYVLSASAEIQNATCLGAKDREIHYEYPVTIWASVPLRQLPTCNSGGMCKEECFEMIGCCRSKGRIHATLSMPTAAYLIGQAVAARVKLDYQHCRRRRPVTLCLIQETHFVSTSFFQSISDSKTVSRVIESLRLDGPEDVKSLQKDAQLAVPVNLPASSLSNTIITIRYKLRLEVENGCELTLPIELASKA